MNIQALRVKLETFAKANLPGWQTTLKSWQEPVGTKTVQIGHAQTVTPDTYRRQRAELLVTLWANESNENAAVASLYEAISWGPESFIAQLSEQEWAKGATVQSVGPRDQGPTGWIAADLTVTVLEIAE